MLCSINGGGGVCAILFKNEAEGYAGMLLRNNRNVFGC